MFVAQMGRRVAALLEEQGQLGVQDVQDWVIGAKVAHSHGVSVSPPSVKVQNRLPLSSGLRYPSAMEGS